jgi:Tfp pilus assembly protein PilF
VDRRLLLALLALWIATAAVYADVRSHDFVDYDDGPYVLENPWHRAGPSAETLLAPFLAPYHDNWIPLTWLSLELDYAWHGPVAAAFLATNVALHALAAALLLLALVRMTGRLGASAFCAGVFALHPLHVESVAWVSERKDVLCGAFFMLALLAHAVRAERPASRLRAGAVFAAGTLAMLAKPSAVILPIALLLLDVWPLGRARPGEPRSLLPLLREKLPLLALAAAVCAVTLVVQRGAGSTAFGEQLPFALRLANAAESTVWYAGRAFWPSGLAVFYPHPERIPAWRAAAAGAALLLASGLALRAARARPWLAVGWLWFLLGLAPAIGLVQVGMQARADRYAYLPLLGLSLALAFDLDARTAGRRGARILAAAAGLLALVGLGLVARAQVATWRDTRSLFERALAVTAGNHLAHHKLGSVSLGEGEPVRAEAHFREAVRLRPRWPLYRLALAEAVARQGRLEEARGHYEGALADDPGHAAGQAKLGAVLLALGREAEARARLERALLLPAEPGDAPARAVAELGLADLALRAGDREAARRGYERALALAPESAQALQRLGLLEAELGQGARARELLEGALERGGASEEVLLALGGIAEREGRAGEAVTRYRAALALAPGSAAAANNLAWILATSAEPGVRDGAGAVALMEPLVARHPEPAFLDTLAAGYAADGRLEAARASAARAESLARERGDAPLAAEIASHRARYARGLALGAGGP